MRMCKCNYDSLISCRFVFHIPESFPLEQATPLLCVGVTIYNPIKNFGYVEAGKRCGVLQLGGIGYIGVKIANAFGHHVTVIISSNGKREEALDVLGVDEYLLSNDATQMHVCNTDIGISMILFCLRGCYVRDP